MSISLKGYQSIFQSSQFTQKSFSSQGFNDKFTFKSFNNNFIFPFYDELLRMVKLNSIFSVIIIIILLIQASKTFPNFTDNDVSDYLTNFNFIAKFNGIFIPLIYFLINILYFVYLFLSYRSKRMFNYWQLYLASLILNFFNVILFTPVCGMCGYFAVQIENAFSNHNLFHITPINIDQNKSNAFKHNAFINHFFQNKINHKYFNNNVKNLRFTNEKNHTFTKNFTKANCGYNIINNSIKNNIFQDHIKKGKEKSIIQDKNVIKKFQDNDNKNKQIFLKSDGRYSIADKNTNLNFQNHKNVIFSNNSNSNKPPLMDNDTMENIQYFFYKNSDFSKYTFSLIISFIEGVIIYFQIFGNFYFASESPYLNRTIFAMWDCRVFVLTILLIGFNQFASLILEIFHKWCTIFYLFVTLLFVLYILYYTFFQPFINIWMNSFFQSLLTYILIENFMYILYTFNGSDACKNVASVAFFFIIIYLFIYYFINKKIINKVDKKLSPPEVKSPDTQTESDQIEEYQFYQLTDQEKRDMFDKYVFQSIDHALLYFRVGITRASPYFIDFSFIRYMKDTYSQKQIQFFILQLSALFPSQHQFFNYCITLASKREDFFNVFEQFIMYQFHRINIVRQSSVSKEVTNELIRLEAMADDSISAIRGFWAEILQTKTEFNAASLGFIRTLAFNTRSCYLDAIDKYPNSTQILNSYCRFLCESYGDYIECIRIGQRKRLIVRGKFENIDYCFRSFVNVFPQYLKRQILDTKGSFIYENQASISSQSLSSLSSAKSSQSFDNARGLSAMNEGYQTSKKLSKNITLKNRRTGVFENIIEQENFDTLINNLFTSGKARLSIQHIVDRSRNHSLVFARFLSILQAILFIIVVCLFFWYIVSFRNPMNFIRSSARESNIIFSLQYCSLIAGIQYLSEFYKVNFTSKIIQKLNIREENLPNFPCSFNIPMYALDQMARRVITLLDEEIQFILNHPDENLDVIRVYNGIILNESDIFFHETYSTGKKKKIKSDFENQLRWEEGIYLVNYNNDKGSTYKTSMRNGLEIFVSQAERLAFEHVYETTNNKKNPNFEQFYDIYFDLLINGVILSQPFFHLFEIISEKGVKIIQTTEKLVVNITASVAVVCFVIFFVARLYAYIKIKESIKMISMVIKKVNFKDIIETMKPIYLKSKNPIKIHSTSNHSIYDFSPSLAIYPLISILSVSISLGFFSFISFQCISSFNFIRKAQEWENDCASRFLSLTVSMNGLIAEYIKKLDFSFSEELSKSYFQLLNISQKIDLSIIANRKSLNQHYFMINQNATVSSSQRAPNNITKNPFKFSKHSKFNDLRKKLNEEEEKEEHAPTALKCNEIYNGNISTQMNIATYLDCISIENRINLGIHFYHLMRDTFHDQELTESVEFIMSLFIIDKYLFRDLPELQDQISETATSEVIKEKENVFIIGIVGIIVILILLLLELLTITHIYYSFNAFKQLIMVLPPAAFSNNPFLLNFLSNSCSSSIHVFNMKNILKTDRSINVRDSRIISEEEILIDSVDEGIVSTDKNLIIQYVNPAIQKLTGFLPDQLLGQALLYLIPLSSKFEDEQVFLEKFPFYQRLGEIQSNHGDRVAELNTKVLTDKGEEILVRVTIIGIFDKKKLNEKTVMVKYNNLNKINQFLLDNADDYDDNNSTSTNTANATVKMGTINSLVNNHQNNISNRDEAEEFVGATIILKDISNERDLKRALKNAKRKNEILLNMLIPLPVLEQVRESKKQAFYSAKTATLIKFELLGFNDYIGKMLPKQIMSIIQVIYSKIDQITAENKYNQNSQKNQSLFDKSGQQQVNNDSASSLNNLIQNSQTSLLKFNFHFDETELSNKNTDDEENITFQQISRSSKSAKTQSSENMNSNDIDDFEDLDDLCDFNCIYNIRSDIDQFVSICGLFDTQDEPQKQAESCVRYALKVKHIIENIGLEEQVNMFIHTKIAVCMGGPMNGFVDDPQNPQFQIFSDLLREADSIKNNGDIDAVYINENVYNNLIKENYEIEEKMTDEFGSFENDLQNIYVVNKCIKKKKKNNSQDLLSNNVFIISGDSEG